MPLPLIPLQRLDGTAWSTADLQGRVVLVVNVASRCGFTPQYTGLEALYRQFGPKASRSWAFPAISSAIRSRAMPRRSPASARSTTRSASP